MRIRKNAKLSPLLFSTQGASSVLPAETFQTHVCQLNQSPWDVIPLDSDSLQFEGEDSFTGNGSAGDSIGAVESVASMMDAEDKTLPRIEDMVVDDNNHDVNDDKGAKVVVDGNGDRVEQKRIASNKREGNTSCCQNTDENGWACKNEAKQGQSFCDHHLSLLRSYNNSAGYNNNHPSSKKAAAAAAAAGARRARARASKKAPSSPYEFYYYSGFGPLWGKRRGDRNGEGNKNGGAGVENSNMVEASPTAAGNIIIPPSDAAIQHNNVPSSSKIDNEEFDYVDDDDEEDANGDSGKKRMRKPVKARSLKSLM